MLRRLVPAACAVALLALPSLARAGWSVSPPGANNMGLDGVFVTPSGTPVTTSEASCNPEDPHAENAPQLAALSAADGHELWSITQTDSHPYDVAGCNPSSIVVDAAGNYYLVGYPKGSPPTSITNNIYLVSYGPSGTFRWASPLDSNDVRATPSAPGLAIGADGNVYALVGVYNRADRPHTYLHAYRDGDGTSLWDVEVPTGGMPRGLYADATGLTVGATIKYDYGGNLIHPEPSAGATQESPIAQEPGGAVYTASTDKAHCSDKKPFYTITVTRWMLKGEDWKKEIRPSVPPISHEECENWVHIAAIESVPGGGVVGTYQNGEEDILFRLDDKQHVLWTHPLQPGWDDFPGDVRVASDGTVVTLQDHREPCVSNRWGECGVVAVSFFDSTTGTSNRPTVFIRNAIQAFWSEPPDEPSLQGEFAVGPDAAYLDLALDGESQVVKLDEPGLGADYREALRVAPGFAPTVTKVSPGRGYWGGGTTVTIKGKYLTDASAVRFGSQASPLPPTVLSDTSITAIAPKGPTDTVDVTVTTPAGTSAVSKKDHFLYEPPAEYVALGDSFASGTGSFSYLTATAGEHGCYRATDGYVEQVTAQNHATLSFVACNGATIGDVIYGPAPQLNQLTSATRLVTLSIGGDDVGFPQVMASCVDAGFLYHGGFGCAQRDEPLAAEAIGWLQNGRQPGTYTLPGIGAETGQPVKTTNNAPLPSLEQLYERVASLAPNARIFVVGYPSLFESGFATPGNCEVAHPLVEVSGDDIGWLNANGNTIDGIIRDAAADAEAHTGRSITFVDPRASFASHGLCDSGSAYINELLLTKKKKKIGSKQESFHPNTAGQDALFTALENAGA
jgi:hypothetical protein